MVQTDKQYLSYLVAKAKETEAHNPFKERVWGYLKDAQLGPKFKRHHPVGAYIVDFICPEKNIVIEVAGGSDATPEELEKDRDLFLRQEGYKVMRFRYNDIEHNIGGVIAAIILALDETPSARPPAE